MKFTNTFTFHAPADEVWTVLLDVERVSPCMPGAEVLERIGDDAYRVGITVKLGPISMRYRGQVEIVDRDDAQRHATMVARAKEARGGGNANATVQMALEERPDGTHATLETEVQVTGKAAAMGQGVMADVAGKLVETFAGNLAAMLTQGPAGGSVGAGEIPAAGGPNAGSASPPPVQPTPSEKPAARTPRAQPAPPRAQPAPPRAQPADNSLPVAQLAAGVIAGRLSNPRTLLAATATLAVAFGAIGVAFGRRR